MAACASVTCWYGNCRPAGAGLHKAGGGRVSGLLLCVFQMAIYIKIFSDFNRCREVKDFSYSRSFSCSILFSQEIISVMQG